MRGVFVSLLGLLVLTGCDELGSNTAPRYAWEQPGRYVVAFTCDGCHACERDKKHYGELRATGVEVIEINADQYPQIAAEYGIARYPTYCVFEDGQLIEKATSWTALLVVLKALFWIASLLLV
jgi:thiol-disulfide isomerase/thioredoxin